MSSPIGPFILNTDTKLLASMDGIIASLQAALSGPLAALLVLYVAVQGYLMMIGHTGASRHILPNALRMAFVVWLATTAAYGTYVEAFAFQIMPDFLAGAVAGGTANNSSIQSAADAYDVLYHQAWRLSDATWEAVSWNGTGAGLAVVGFLCASTASACLLLMAAIYEGARVVLALLVILGPVLVACWLFPATRRYAHNAVGKVVALLVLGAMTIIVSQIMLTQVGAEMTTLLAEAATGGVTGRLQGLSSMVLTIIGAALVSVVLVPISYSIGGGMGVRGPGIMLALGNMTRAGVSAGRGSAWAGAATQRIREAVGDSLSSGRPSPARTRDLLSRARR